MALEIQNVDYLQYPAGTTAQRPTSPAAGMTRFNTDTLLMEYYNGTAWISI
jgi:hypothetical protein